MMKRILCLILILSLVLCIGGCKKKTPENTDNTQESTYETENNNTQESIETSESEGTTEDLQPVVKYRHPLTGEPMEQPWSGTLVAVMVNNIKKSMPQHGVSDADIVFEMEEEGGITRNMALYSDLTGVGSVGSIRSARTYFVSVAASFDAYLVHCGTSVHAERGGVNQSGDRLSNWKHIDQQAGANSKYFFRDSERYQNGYGWEHTLFTTGEKLTEALQGKEQSKLTGGEDFGMKFDDNIQLDGEQANEVTIQFKGKKTSTFTYDASTGLYKRSQYSADSIDGNTGDTMVFKNVIALYTKQWSVSSGHQFYDTIGKGEGYAAINGKIVPILWSRENYRSPFVYTLADGTPLTLNVGTTYIAMVGTKYPISYK